MPLQSPLSYSLNMLRKPTLASTTGYRWGIEYFQPRGMHRSTKSDNVFDAKAMATGLRRAREMRGVANVPKTMKQTTAVGIKRHWHALNVTGHMWHGTTAAREGRKKWKGWKYSGPLSPHTSYARKPRVTPITDQPAQT